MIDKISLRFTILALLLFPAACAATKGIYHTVQPGQTFYSISRLYSVNEQYLARLNNIDDPAKLHYGQRLFIPGATRIIDLPANSPEKNSVSKKSAVKKAASVPVARSSTPPLSVPVSSKNATQQSTPIVPAVAKGTFAWPLKGDMLRGFGQSGNRSCNGVEIGVPEETPIQAAAAGQVTYSGDGIRGYGNLIIIRHDDSFFTVYGFNRKNLVASGAFVNQGEQIALSGRPPSGGTPRLHFEIRQKKAPINPIFYLP